ncbi:MAG: PVC-type heme-binding CxxCH protein [Verrucomicrobiota bacterium]
MAQRFPLLALIILLGLGHHSPANPPPLVPDDISPKTQLLQPGLTLSLVVDHPEIVTPTGIDVDEKGRIWTVASHTHFRPDPYPGPDKDEVLLFEADGSNRRVFYNATVATMDLELGDQGWVYLAERDRILRIRDTDGDEIADQEEDIAVLETTSTYPHNGLSGLSWAPNGDLLFALGENFWKQWTLTGTDGSAVIGTGEGGIFRCSPEGDSLRRVAKGFWNPFGVCVREDGEIFAAENDPGSRPPCRMLHIVEGGDYGYNRRYGNAPVHPFVAWNGELPGTLPMLHPSGEAPCGILPLGGGLIAGSWSDHRVDFYPLTRKGATFTTKRIPLISGSDHFRPTCFAYGPDGKTIYFTDWALTFYHLHQRGRIWKLEISEEDAHWLSFDAEPPNAETLLAAELRRGKPDLPLEQLLAICQNDDDPFLAQAALMELSRRDVSSLLQSTEANTRSALLARQLAAPKDVDSARKGLAHSSARIRFEALRWIANEDLSECRESVAELLLQPDLDYALFEAALATSNTLAGRADQGVADVGMLLQRLSDEQAPPTIRAYALRLISPTDRRMTPKLINQLLQVDDDALHLEVCRVLAARSDEATLPIVLRLLQQDSTTDRSASFLILRLAADPSPHQELLQNLASRLSHPEAAGEAQRALRTSFLTDLPPLTDPDAWLAAIAALTSPPDLAAGERLFHHPRLARCATCHRHAGRGRIVGPDLSLVGERNDRSWLLTSILQPQAEVPPQFHPRSVTLKNGETFVGFPLRNGGRSGKEFYRDITGDEVALVKAEIEHRTELELSLMPPGLLAALTLEEVRDLLCYLEDTH